MSISLLKVNDIQIRLETIPGVTVPKRAADCAVMMRSWAKERGRLPRVTELSESLSISPPAVVQLERTLETRGILHGSRQDKTLRLERDILISDSAIVGLVTTKLSKVGVDEKVGIDTYIEMENETWNEEMFIDNAQEGAKRFGLNIDNLDDLAELVDVGYLVGKPRRFRFSEALWEKNKIVLGKIFCTLIGVETPVREENISLASSFRKCISEVKKYLDKGIPIPCGDAVIIGHTSKDFITLKNNVHSKTKMEIMYFELCQWRKAWQEANKRSGKRFGSSIKQSDEETRTASIAMEAFKLYYDDLHKRKTRKGIRTRVVADRVKRKRTQ